MAGDLQTGQVTVPTGKGGAQLPLGIASSGAGGTIWLKPKHANASPMYVGQQVPGNGQPLSSLNGFELSPTDPAVGPIDGVQGQDLFVTGAVGDTMTWMSVAP